jgi:hypothetical protein
MSIWTAAVIIIALLVLGDVLKSKHRARQGAADLRGQDPGVRPVDDAALKREVEELRERVKVLERITTEDQGSKRLSAEIESLREK